MSFRVDRIQDIGEGSDIDVCAHGAIRAVNGFAVPIAINAVEAIDEQTPSVVDVNMERSDADALDLEDIVVISARGESIGEPDALLEQGNGDIRSIFAVVIVEGHHHDGDGILIGREFVVNGDICIRRSIGKIPPAGAAAHAHVLKLEMEFIQSGSLRQDVDGRLERVVEIKVEVDGAVASISVGKSESRRVCRFIVSFAVNPSVGMAVALLVDREILAVDSETESLGVRTVLCGEGWDVEGAGTIESLTFKSIGFALADMVFESRVCPADVDNPDAVVALAAVAEGDGAIEVHGITGHGFSGHPIKGLDVAAEGVVEHAETGTRIIAHPRFVFRRR